jgi:hypothetical protein
VEEECAVVSHYWLLDLALTSEIERSALKVLNSLHRCDAQTRKV